MLQQRIPLASECRKRTSKGMNKGKDRREGSGSGREGEREEQGQGQGQGQVEGEVEVEIEEEGEGMHEFKDESGGLFCALYIPDASRYGHGPHPTVMSVYGGDYITTSILSYLFFSYLILSFPFLLYLSFLFFSFIIVYGGDYNAALLFVFSSF